MRARSRPRSSAAGWTACCAQRRDRAARHPERHRRRGCGIPTSDPLIAEPLRRGRASSARPATSSALQRRLSCAAPTACRSSAWWAADAPEGHRPRCAAAERARRAAGAAGRPRQGRARATSMRSRRSPRAIRAGRGRHRLQRGARAPDRGGRRYLPDAVAFRALRAEPDVQPALRHAAGRARDRRPRRHHHRR